MTLVCVPIMVESVEQALAESALAAEHGADLVELRIDGFIDADSDAQRAGDLSHLVTDCALPTIVTCRHSSEGGECELDAEGVVALYSRLASLPRPPRYIDIELARTGGHEHALKAIADGDTGVIVSMHDFEGRPADLTRRLSRAYASDFATVVKVAYRARSLRDNLELFEILRDAPKPTIALGMGEFGLMSRVLAPKFGGLLTFAALRDSATTAPGQPTLDDLFNLYRFRKIGPETKVYGVIGWPVTHSMSPLVHNAGFEAIGWDGVYLPMPVADSRESLKATLAEFRSFEPFFWGASVTVPHKEHLCDLARDDQGLRCEDEVKLSGSANTIVAHKDWNMRKPGVKEWMTDLWMLHNTDARAVARAVDQVVSARDAVIALIGAGGVGRAAAGVFSRCRSRVVVLSRRPEQASALAQSLNVQRDRAEMNEVEPMPLEQLRAIQADLYINCTPVGMKDGPEPEGMSIPVHELAGKLPPETVFFDSVYNPIETPMLKAAKEHGFRTIDGVQMFVAQAEAQFELWTGQMPPEGLFDRLVRGKLSAE